MKSGFDINRIENDGYLIMPLSMSRLAAGQSPEECYEVFKYFLSKLEAYSNDVVLLYTNGLYMNAGDASFELRKKLNLQTLNHAVALRSLIQKKKEFIPNAFHFLPIDYVILNSPYFSEYQSKLKKLEETDEKFRAVLTKDAAGREYNEANVHFLLEEIVVAHLLRQRSVELPRTLVRNDIWRLIVYPGGYLEADAYQWKQKVLPQNDVINPYGGAQYDFSEKKLFIFDKESI